MALKASTKRTRASRTSSVQYEELITYMESYPKFAAGRYLTKEGKLHHMKQWKQLALKLNALSTGTKKSIKQWQTVWRDMKSTACIKASKLRNESNRTGNFPVTAPLLNTIDQRVLSCIGLEYVQESVNCPNSIPEAEEDQLILESDKTTVLHYTPITTSIEDVFVDTSINRENRPKIGVQLQEACGKFSDIAEKQAEALQLFAEASIKMAENDSKRLLLEEKRLEIEEKRITIEGQIYKVLTNLLDKTE